MAPMFFVEPFSVTPTGPKTSSRVTKGWDLSVRSEHGAFGAAFSAPPKEASSALGHVVSGFRACGAQMEAAVPAGWRGCAGLGSANGRKD